MHHAWHVEDVRSLIFKQCLPCDLAHLAQCCSALFEPATDELWSTLKSFQPFLCCLPMDLRNRRLEAEELQRLDYYACKVQRIHIENRHRSVDPEIPLPGQFGSRKMCKKKGKGPSNEKKAKSLPNKGKQPERSWKGVWTEIAELRPNVAFLPNLRMIRVSSIVEEMLFPLVGISGTKLEYIYIKYLHRREPQSLVNRFLYHLGDTSRLEYLFIRDGEPNIIPLKVLQNAPLRHLRVDPRIAHKVEPEDHQLRLEILQKTTLEHLTLGLTSKWNENDALMPRGELNLEGLSLGNSQVRDRRKYLPALKTLWLNLLVCPPDLIGNQSPAVFFKSLDKPSLELLNIKFRYDVTQTMLLDVVRAVSENCKLQNLSELALSSGGNYPSCNCMVCTAPLRVSIMPHDMRRALQSLLPLPHLKVLRMNATPNFLDMLDLKLYQSFADGLPILETLQIGHSSFVEEVEFWRTSAIHRIPLVHLAAFCRMLPNLKHLEAACVAGTKREQVPRIDWCCPHVETFRVTCWVQADENGRWAYLLNILPACGLQDYFPNSNLAKEQLKGNDARLDSYHYYTHDRSST